MVSPSGADHLTALCSFRLLAGLLFSFIVEQHENNSKSISSLMKTCFPSTRNRIYDGDQHSVEGCATLKLRSLDISVIQVTANITGESVSSNKQVNFSK